jgi:hypothetical protein
MNEEGPYRGHCLTVPVKEISFAKQMQQKSHQAQLDNHAILKRDTEKHYDLIREHITNLANRGITSTNTDELINVYTQKGKKPSRDVLETLLGHDGFKLERIQGNMKYPTTYKVSWHCL